MTDAHSHTDALIEVRSPTVAYTPTAIVSDYVYRTTACTVEAFSGGAGPSGAEADASTPSHVVVAAPVERRFMFTTQRKVPKTGVMIVGWGGNNGTTVTAGILANKLGVTWRTKSGVHTPDYLGSLTQASTIRLGVGADGRDVFVPFNRLLPMVSPNDFVLGGWDISSMNLGDAMERAEVLDYDLQRQLYPLMKDMKPLPSVYVRDFIAANQEDRADNLITGTKAEQVERIREDIRKFKADNGLDKVVVLWSANTERFADIVEGVNDTADNMLASIAKSEEEVSPSSMFAVASILEGCSYINGSPQNTFVPGVMELAKRHNVFIGGDDFKSGQTKMKSVLVDFLVSSGLKPTSIVSYNHLGNNDGKNLSAPKQFRSKEISKSNVVDDMVASNRMMYKEGEHPDHTVVIKYVPTVKDSKRALDEYTSDIFMGGTNTISMHNTCEDSLLAAPLIIDLVCVAELCERITLAEVTPEMASASMAAARDLSRDASVEESKKVESSLPAGERFHNVLSLLSFMLKAPLVPSGTPVINALFRQREALVNVLRACVGLPPENWMSLEHRMQSAGTMAMEGARLAAAAAASAGAGAAGATPAAGSAAVEAKAAAEADAVEPVPTTA